MFLFLFILNISNRFKRFTTKPWNAGTGRERMLLSLTYLMSLSKKRVVALAEWWRYTVHTIMSVTQCDHTTSGVRSAWYLTVISSLNPSSTPAPDHPGSNLAPGLQRSASRLSVYTATALAERNEQLFICEDNSSLIISKRLVTVAECRPKAGIYRHLMSDNCPTAGLSLSL